MSEAAELTDNYLAALLSKEAAKPGGGRIGLTARPKDAPKPNVRFLQHLIKDTDNHNAVLLERDRRLAADKLRHRSMHTEKPVDDDRPTKKRRTERPDRWASALGQSVSRSSRNDDKDRSKPDTQPEDRHSRSSHDRPERQRRRHHLRSRSPRDSDGKLRSSRHRDRSRDKHPRRLRSRSTSSKERKSHRPGYQRHRSKSPRKQAKQHDSDSDPLEAIVGPRLPPKVKPRGRGTTAESSGIDARFADPSYNPATDVQHDLGEDNDDWDQALSTLQDRAKWRALGADRLRAAGFAETDIAKWEASSRLLAADQDREQGIENVIWKKRGEARDWDRGKVVQADGDIVTKAAWSLGDD